MSASLRPPPIGYLGGIPCRSQRHYNVTTSSTVSRPAIRGFRLVLFDYIPAKLCYMAEIFRVKAVGTGWQGGPGLTQFWFDTDPILNARENADEALNLVSAFYETVKGYLIDGSTWGPEADIDFFEDTDGRLLERYVSNQPTTDVSGTDSSFGNSRATMIASKLSTSDVINNRVLVGRHFIGPIGNDALDPDGSLSAGVAQTIATAYAGMIDIVGPNLVVWHRPTSKGATDGKAGRVRGAGVSMSVPAVLRSRRD